ncbi:MAG: hypothetical protein D6732_22055 [Methanobacteriota archaeon]|nr:MAG: hypothetical protein D6732_22055 [Euryarchaeota archaeon]
MLYTFILMDFLKEMNWAVIFSRTIVTSKTRFSILGLRQVIYPSPISWSYIDTFEFTLAAPLQSSQTPTRKKWREGLKRA